MHKVILSLYVGDDVKHLPFEVSAVPQVGEDVYCVTFDEDGAQLEITARVVAVSGHVWTDNQSVVCVAARPLQEGVGDNKHFEEVMDLVKMWEPK